MQVLCYTSDLEENFIVGLAAENNQHDDHRGLQTTFMERLSTVRSAIFHKSGENPSDSFVKELPTLSRKALQEVKMEIVERFVPASKVRFLNFEILV